MEIKAQLNKPYTENQRIDFIVICNHNLGYKIEETDNALEAWGYTDEEHKIQEQERIARLTMTALDFIGVLKQTGLTALQIKEYLDANIELDMQLKYCQNVYCGVVCQLCPLSFGDITITQEDIIRAFKIKNGENVTTEENSVVENTQIESEE